LNATFNIRWLLPLVVIGAGVAALLFFTFQVGRPAPSTGGTTGAEQELVAILQYLESDYPAAVASKNAGELAEQRALSGDALSIATQLPGVAAFVGRLASIDARVQHGADPTGVSADCASLVDDLIVEAGISRKPSAPPDLEQGEQLFAQTCAGCHGTTGHGDGPAGSALNPKPASFHAPEVMAGLTPFKAFNVIRFGVKGTSMPAFAGFDEKQRWALAFYLFSLREPDCDHSPRRVSLDDLSNRSDDELAKKVGASEVPCLRRRFLALDAPALLAAARSQVDVAARLASRGDRTGAEKAILDAYLSDVEPIEPWLRARDPEALNQLEGTFTVTRAALQQDDPKAHDDTSRLMALLERAAEAHAGTAKKGSVFWFALLVILREGFEAAVIVAALLAVLKKRKQVSRARFVHLGWTSALVVGAVVFVLGRKVLAGAMDEKLEGCLAFVAVAMLLHAALWLNARSTTRKTMGDLRERTRGALDRGAVGLFAIAFLAVFRESFETAVFLEALSIDAPSAVVWGASAGAVLLVALVVAVDRLGLRLPMQTLFKASTLALVATAVVLLGQGIHSFEEVGLFPSHPMGSLRVELLGIYPDRIGVLGQVALSAGLILWKVLSRSPEPRLPGLDPAE
jgi:high-affinity iron transporter